MDVDGGGGGGGGGGSGRSPVVDRFSPGKGKHLAEPDYTSPGLDPDQASSSGALSVVSTEQEQQPKRRRGSGVVTANACVECRKKRVKCDGRRPCGRCRQQRDMDCVYATPVRKSKEDLRAEIEHLHHRLRASETVLATLARRSDLWVEMLQRLQRGDAVEHIAAWVDGGGGPRPPLQLPPQLPVVVQPVHPPGACAPFVARSMGYGPSSTAAASRSPSAWSAQQAPLSAAAQSRPSSAWAGGGDATVTATDDDGGGGGGGGGSLRFAYRGMEQVLTPATVPMLADTMLVPASMWTDVTNDGALVQHLLALYFCWEYPTFASLSKEQFVRDFADGRPRYCSPLLVNALLALGCRFSARPQTRATPGDAHSAGDHFFRECHRLLARDENHHRLTTIQALGIMSIREASCGRDSESCYYAGQSIRLATEMGLHRIADDGVDTDDKAVQEATFWGAFALDQAWSLATGMLPQTAHLSVLPPKPAIIADIEASLWTPYTDDGVPLERPCQQPSNVRTVYRCFCELSELVYRSLYLLHAPGRLVSSRDVLHIYNGYLNWYDSISEVLRLGYNFTPAVLFAHMYYHFAILLLFRPLIKLGIVHSRIRPVDICLQAADAIKGLLNSYARLYTLQRTPSFVPYFVLTSTIMHLAIAASGGVGVAPAAGPEPSLARRPKEVADAAGDATGRRPSAVGPGMSKSSIRSGNTRVTTTVDSVETTVTSTTTTTTTTKTSNDEDEDGDEEEEDDDDDDSQDTSRNTTSVTTPVVVRPSLDESVVESIRGGIADLTEMVPCHRFAGQALNILRFLAKKWHIEAAVTPPRASSPPPPPPPPPAAAGTTATVAAAEEADAVTATATAGARKQEHAGDDRRLRPATTSLRVSAPNATVADHDSGRGQHKDSGRAAAVAAAAAPTKTAKTAKTAKTTKTTATTSSSHTSSSSATENPAFWLFPTQGRPLLPSGEQLKEAGFYVL